MKSERRHELRENELAHELGKVGEYVKNNLVRLATGLLLFVVLIALVFSYFHNRKITLQTEWAQYMTNTQNVVDRIEAGQNLLTLAGETSQNALAAYAFLAGGEQLMVEADYKWNDLTVEERDKLIKRAEAAFTKVAASFADNKVAVAKARLDLGRVAELQGDYKAAAAHYDAVAKMPVSEGAIRSEALNRLAVANNPPVAVELASKPAEPDQPASDEAEAADAAAAVEEPAATAAQ